MHPFLRLTVLLGILLLASCRSLHQPAEPSRTWELARVQVADRTEVLEFHSGTEGRLQWRAPSGTVVGSLGVGVVELDKERASRIAQRPFSGVLVATVHADGPAARGGMQAGDVIARVDGRETLYLETWREVEAACKPGATVGVQVLRGSQSMDLTLTAGSFQYPSALTRPVAMTMAPEVTATTGLVLRGMPRDASEAAFGPGANGVLVASVKVGSPAWQAGFRGGDRIVSVDDKPVPPLEDLAPRLAQDGVGGTPVRLVAVRGSEQHEATFTPAVDEGTKRIHIPLVYHREATRVASEWILAIGILAGGERMLLPDTNVRTDVAATRFHALLGLFQVRNEPEGGEVRLLWFIHFDT